MNLYFSTFYCFKISLFDVDEIYGDFLSHVLNKNIDFHRWWIWNKMAALSFLWFLINYLFIHLFIYLFNKKYWFPSMMNRKQNGGAVFSLIFFWFLSPRSFQSDSVCQWMCLNRASGMVMPANWQLPRQGNDRQQLPTFE